MAAYPWYLSHMVRSPADTVPWCFPPGAYEAPGALTAMSEHVCKLVPAAAYDVVCGIDAAGYVLGGAVSAQTGRGFVVLRKKGKIPLPDLDSVNYVDYSGTQKALELRRGALARGTRVLLVDQWLETGGTMDAAARLVERQGAVVVACAALAAEDKPLVRKLRERYRFAVLASDEVRDAYLRHHRLPPPVAPQHAARL
eukprot:TRINITY_DN11539_c0_g1_i1.p1 TRINITY_DN11539_c0_g1~~TRINITY_DN11539_c0_g1_i1.p1  ORF type:complete len:198 (+),score=58.07 TRINITY_DN11539_c0_g1_i1:80-673(+)